MFNTMRKSEPLYCILGLTMIVLIAACGGLGGDVVKVTTVQKGSYAKLKEEDLARLQEIKKDRDDKGISEDLRTVIEETRHFSAARYLAKYPETRVSDRDNYRVGGNDVLRITVYEEKDLSKESVRVSGDGSISFPLIGRVHVDNLTTSEIEELISRKLAEGQYLLDAHVSVMVNEYNSKCFLVLGAVRDPGSYSLQGQERVLDAISTAGGIRRAREGYAEPVGAGNRAMIIRKENQNTSKEFKIVINIDLQGLLKGRDQISNLYLADEDIIFIPTAEHFYIIGQVLHPGSYPLDDREITLVEAISMAGGFTRIAAQNRTRIIRVENRVEKIIEVKVDAITDAGKKIQDVVIEPNDVIVVPESFF
ncbi:MAG: polysaccharide biosynthesis/export family protein [Thermodesulfobacteriota bacterium]|nr:polysaccharide biosynthesis/export family protein [Thermodesulfobacteriota bacterium]